MKEIKVLITFLFVILSLFSLGQTKKTIKYKIVNDNPMDIKRLEININPVLMDFVVPLHENGGGDVTFNTNLRVNYFPINEKLGVNLNIQLAQGLINSFNYTRMNLTGTYALNSTSNKKDRAFILSRTRSGNAYTQTVKTKSLTVPQTRQTNFELRGGLNRGTGYLGKILIDGHTNKRNIIYQGFGLSGGVQLRKFYHQRLSFDNKYSITNSRTQYFYADALLMPFSSVETVGTGYNSYPSDAEIKDAVKENNLKSMLGVVVGFRHSENRHQLFGWSGGIEAGIHAPSKNLILNFTFGFTINAIKG